MKKPLIVTLWTERQSYAPGDPIRVFFRSNKACYVRLVHVDAEGRALQLLPNPYRNEERFRPDEVVSVPAQDDAFLLEAGPPFGRERIVLFASTLPLRDLDVTPSGLSVCRTGANWFTEDTRIGMPEAGGLEKQSSGAEWFETQVEYETKKP